MKITVKPNKPIAKQWMAYLVTIIFVAVPILIGVCFTKGWDISSIIGLSIMLFLLLVFKIAFAWYRYYTIEKHGDYIEVTNIDVLSSLGNNKDKYKIRNIQSYKIRGTKCKVFGDIEVKEPLQKPKIVKSMVLVDITDEVINMIKEN